MNPYACTSDGAASGSSSRLTQMCRLHILLTGGTLEQLLLLLHECDLLSNCGRGEGLTLGCCRLLDSVEKVNDIPKLLMLFYSAIRLIQSPFTHGVKLLRLGPQPVSVSRFSYQQTKSRNRNRRVQICRFGSEGV
ncbi:unnamed protein product [Pleuronectes platessa]|uniref:Uncharacterized protein n=1 Tax=Pleuronectes platessa TaxID=8262 RepID=A0A9N7YE06_PLEPL|nr:unnamed protein product [Pleuronectes platessa]